MGMTALECFVAGQRIQPGATSETVSSFDATMRLPVAEVTPRELRAALRFADESQKWLGTTRVQERIEVARFLIREYSRRRADVAWALAHFRGNVARDANWMCDINSAWADGFEQLIGTWSGAAGGKLSLAVTSGSTMQGHLMWRTRGKAALFSSSTMDGPPAVVALCHGILSGTHMLMRPSFRDAATHIAFEILYAHGLERYGQLVRWRSETPEGAALNKQMLSGVSQSIVFSSDSTCRRLIDDAADPGTSARDRIAARTRRYGTGLPLAIVTPRTDLALAAAELVEGARLGNGRFCLSTCPVMVLRDAYDPLKNELVDRARTLSPGSLLDETTDLGRCDPVDKAKLVAGLTRFGGRVEFGGIHDEYMDVVVMGDTPSRSPCLYEELPATVLCLLPVSSLEEAVALGQASLARNEREAWTAVTCYGDEGDFETVRGGIDSFRFLDHGITSHVELMLPHQGSYFGLDLMRRTTIERHVANRSEQR